MLLIYSLWGEKLSQRKFVSRRLESGRLKEVGRFAKKTIRDIWEYHFVSLSELKGARKTGAQHQQFNRMGDLKAHPQLPALLPEESRRKELDDSPGKQFLGSLAFVAHNAHSLELGKDAAIDGNKYIHEEPASWWKGDRALDGAYITHNLSWALNENNNNGCTMKTFLLCVWWGKTSGCGSW